MNRIAGSICVLGMAVASAAMTVSAGAAEGPLLRLGIVSDSHCSFLHDPEDRNTWGHQSTKTLQNAFTKFREWGVDAVVHPGDLTNYGALKELEATGTVWNRVFPDDLDADGRKVEKLFVRGNHDKMGKEDDLDKLIRKDPAKAWKDVFGVDWYTEKVMLRRVKGYVFVLADWEATKKDLDDFFTARENDLPKAKPFFFVCHAPPFGTVDPPQDEFGDRCGGDNIQCARWLKKFPNCIALTGHSHYSLTLGDQIWQEDFLSIGCGSLKYTEHRRGRDNSWSNEKDTKLHAKRCDSGRQGLYMRVYADRIVLERWDFVNNEKVGPDHVVPLDGTRPYSWAEQRRRARAPEFPENAVLAFEERDGRCCVLGGKWTPERQLWVVVPRAAECARDEGRVYEYECKVFAEGDEQPMLVRRELAGGYFLNDARVERRTIVPFGMDELPAGKKFRFEVRAMDCWGNRSRPLVGCH